MGGFGGSGFSDFTFGRANDIFKEVFGNDGGFFNDDDHIFGQQQRPKKQNTKGKKTSNSNAM